MDLYDFDVLYFNYNNLIKNRGLKWIIGENIDRFLKSNEKEYSSNKNVAIYPLGHIFYKKLPKNINC